MSDVSCSFCCPAVSVELVVACEWYVWCGKRPFINAKYILAAIQISDVMYYVIRYIPVNSTCFWNKLVKAT